MHDVLPSYLGTFVVYLRSLCSLPSYYLTFPSDIYVYVTRTLSSPHFIILGPLFYLRITVFIFVSSIYIKSVPHA